MFFGKTNYSNFSGMAYLMRFNRPVKSVTIQVTSVERDPDIKLYDITEYFDSQKQEKLTEMMRSSSSVRNIAHCQKVALRQMTAQLIAEAKLKEASQQLNGQASKKAGGFLFGFWQR